MPDIPTCPVCGRPASAEDAPIGIPLCMPSSCPAWRTQAVYDHERREWLTTDEDGYVVDGRRIDEVP